MYQKENALHWDMTRFYPSLESKEYCLDKQNLGKALETFTSDVESFVTTDITTQAKTLCKLEKLEAQYYHLWFYTLCLLGTNGLDETRITEHNAILALGNKIDSSIVLIKAAIIKISDKNFEHLLEHLDLAGAAHHLIGLRHTAQNTLSNEKETLAADLRPSSYTAWANLRNKIANKLTFTMTWPDGRREVLPVSRQSDLMSNPDNAVRKTSAIAISEAWESRQDTIAACMNGMAGTRIALSSHKGYTDVLEETLQNTWIKHKTLTTMMSVVAANKSIWWRYLKLKAKLLGKEKLAIFDRLALLPLNTSDQYSVPEAVDMVLNAFSRALPGQADYARMAIDTGCVEYANGPGYSGTGIVGFAAHSPVLAETRVYTEYHGSLVDINILAHELGHGYHSQQMLKLRPWQMNYPGTLAESASTVAEGIFRQSLIQDPDSSIALKLQALSMQMDSAVNYLLRIPRDFDFEYAFYRQRSKEELNAQRITSLMAKTHDQWFGDSLDPQYKDEMHWASKAYFCTNYGCFLNYHYTFGYLFSAALLRRVLSVGKAFDEPYKALLKDTGSMNAEILAQKHLDVDIGQAAFWQKEIDHLAKQLYQFEQLAQQRFPGILN